MRNIQRLFCVAISLSLALHFQIPAKAQEGFVRDPEAVKAFEAGTQLLEQEKWDDAITAFTKATEIDPTLPEAFLGLGDALRALEDYQTAITNYRQALDINPKLARALYGRGVCYKELGDFNAAATDIGEASQLDRKDPEIAADWGELLVNTVRDPVRAIRFLDTAIELNPSNAEAYRNRGSAHILLRDFDEAVRDLEKSLEVDPDDFETYTTLATVYLYQEEYEPAIEALSSAIEKYEPEESQDPDSYISGYLSRADAEIKLAKLKETPEQQKKALYDAAIADADAVLEEFPDRFPESGLALHRRGVALRMQGRLGEAIKTLTDAIQLAPAGERGGYISEAYLKRGICWHYQEQGSLARGDFEQAATINFEDPLPHLWIGYTYAQEEDYRKAIDSYGEAVSRNPAFPLIYINRGLAYIQLEEYNKGVENFNEAIRHESDDFSMARHFYKRGIAYLRLEEYQKAFDSFHLATLNDETYEAAFRQASAALRKLGKPSLAEQYENRANALNAPAT
ncbi:MAG: tetratricopeptide repeat protein [Pirellulales bacterium]|nr:tetratricopeptide repeat protein [Pirellulales bacterium]